MAAFDEIEDRLRSILLDEAEAYADQISFNIRERGLVLTGSLAKSPEARIVATPSGLKAQVLINDYGLVWETGVSRTRIDRFVRSEPNFISRLTRYMAARGSRNPRAAAEATIHVWYREGAPTRASRRYSNAPAGERTRFVQRAIEKLEPGTVSRIEEQAAEVTLVSVTNSIRRIIRATGV